MVVPSEFIFFLLSVCLVVAGAIISLDKHSGCGLLSPSGNVSWFRPCINSEWEERLTGLVTPTGPDFADAPLQLPISTNIIGCSAHGANYFAGKIALIARGSCNFDTKTVFAQNAGALAVLIYDNTNSTTVGLLALSSMVIPRIPAWLILLSDGMNLNNSLQAGSTLQVHCGWAALEFWIDRPGGPNKSASMKVSNTGNASLEHYYETKFWHMTAAFDALYSGTVVTAPGAFSAGGAPAGSSVTSLAALYTSADVVQYGNRSLHLPKAFEHYTRYYSDVTVSPNGLIVLGALYRETAYTSGTLGNSSLPNGIIAPFWTRLVCNRCAISAFSASDITAIRYENLTYYDPAAPLNVGAGPLTFEAWLYTDGTLLFSFETYPKSVTVSKLSEIRIGVERIDGAVGVDATSSLPFSAGAPFAVKLSPWFRPGENSNVLVPANESVTVQYAFDDIQKRNGWLYVHDVNGVWADHATVRIMERKFRKFWNMSAWSGDIHSGVCATGDNRSRNKTCMGNDGSLWPDADCVGTCWDLQNNSSAWTDAFGNTCEIYSALNFCFGIGVGYAWRFGSFSTYAVSGQKDAGTACCDCGGGSYTSPPLVDNCPSVPCPTGSSGVSVKVGCTCNSGYSGNVTQSSMAPYYNGTCTPVACPSNSVGTNVVSGCTCSPGYTGTITKTSIPPYYSGNCTATWAPTRTPSNSPTFQPTVAPTPSPTITPTRSPTVSPTFSPTPSPTSSPTFQPTEHPTSEPTSWPTVAPTDLPTSVPTASPTLQPTENPTEKPTVSPTGAPTNSPTSLPTSFPTVQPSDDSTAAPTSAPSVAPTSSPTSQPTSSPTFQPTLDPTALPTTTPSVVPTALPSSLPTDSPTSQPTDVPTAKPTDAPTILPRSLPTSSPTSQPSESPSAAPTISPIATPTKLPTSTPTSSPTFQPTENPTAAPTISPTATPTVTPTSPPTLSPTWQPSVDPTAAPTSAPTFTPTNSPTSQPTSSPTFEPTEDPTAVPTTTPTAAPTLSPSSFPTNLPTPQPTDVPTAEPTSLPTNAPTFSPTPLPTSSATFQPTENPTAAPTISPTATPTSPPTLSPTWQPSTDPTAAPTSAPTITPTNSPTSQPTSSPTLKPTEDPTALPTTTPTAVPTFSPSAFPTSLPTPQPTDVPTEKPTSLPTYAPTFSPTSLPTSSPTFQPSENPTAAPTISPTATPTIMPTSPPTLSPTWQPSVDPTEAPTSAPTFTPTNSPTSHSTSSPSVKPTEDPTALPTSAPTVFPTFSPSSFPTSLPTPQPTDVPTAEPTNSPTDAPTFSPSKNPTAAPTNSPTAPPTVTPTSPPTLSPTRQPSMDPTATPTSTPTFSPTSSQSSQPTSLPTFTRTEYPTALPTTTPTAVPTFSPSSFPTSLPTPQPTDVPTEKPTRLPTYAPTFSLTPLPTSSPTFQPTRNPTAAPTISPIAIPTITPTSPPTLSPTWQPSMDPTAAPTSAPTFTPTNSPAAQPTSSPTGKPTEDPTALPTTAPTVVPTVLPSSFPTNLPTPQPTDVPTETPTGLPTYAPSFSPTPLPAFSPTFQPTENPTEAPTLSPTWQPSIDPIAAPTSAPTFTPTNSPTSQPTSSPTLKPTEDPTAVPTTTDSPSLVPTLMPTALNETFVAVGTANAGGAEAKLTNPMQNLASITLSSSEETSTDQSFNSSTNSLLSEAKMSIGGAKVAGILAGGGFGFLVTFVSCGMFYMRFHRKRVSESKVSDFKLEAATPLTKVVVANRLETDLASNDGGDKSAPPLLPSRSLVSSSRSDPEETFRGLPIRPEHSTCVMPPANDGRAHVDNLPCVANQTSDVDSEVCSVVESEEKALQAFPVDLTSDTGGEKPERRSISNTPTIDTSRSEGTECHASKGDGMALSQMTWCVANRVDESLPDEEPIRGKNACTLPPEGWSDSDEGRNSARVALSPRLESASELRLLAKDCAEKALPAEPLILEEPIPSNLARVKLSRELESLYELRQATEDSGEKASPPLALESIDESSDKGCGKPDGKIVCGSRSTSISANKGPECRVNKVEGIALSQYIECLPKRVDESLPDNEPIFRDSSRVSPPTGWLNCHESTLVEPNVPASKENLKAIGSRHHSRRDVAATNASARTAWAQDLVENEANVMVAQSSRERVNVAGWQECRDGPLFTRVERRLPLDQTDIIPKSGEDTYDVLHASPSGEREVKSVAPVKQGSRQQEVEVGEGVPPVDDSSNSVRCKEGTVRDRQNDVGFLWRPLSSPLGQRVQVAQAKGTFWDDWENASDALTSDGRETRDAIRGRLGDSHIQRVEPLGEGLRDRGKDACDPPRELWPLGPSGTAFRPEVEPGMRHPWESLTDMVDAERRLPLANNCINQSERVKESLRNSGEDAFELLLESLQSGPPRMGSGRRVEAGFKHYCWDDPSDTATDTELQSLQAKNNTSQIESVKDSLRNCGEDAYNLLGDFSPSGSNRIGVVGRADASLRRYSWEEPYDVVFDAEERSLRFNQNINQAERVREGLRNCGEDAAELLREQSLPPRHEETNQVEKLKALRTRGEDSSDVLREFNLRWWPSGELDIKSVGIRLMNDLDRVIHSYAGSNRSTFLSALEEALQTWRKHHLNPVDGAHHVKNPHLLDQMLNDVRDCFSRRYSPSDRVSMDYKAVRIDILMAWRNSMALACCLQDRGAEKGAASSSGALAAEVPAMPGVIAHVEQSKILRNLARSPPNSSLAKARGEEQGRSCPDVREPASSRIPPRSTRATVVEKGRRSSSPDAREMPAPRFPRSTWANAVIEETSPKIARGADQRRVPARMQLDHLGLEEGAAASSSSQTSPLASFCAPPRRQKPALTAWEAGNGGRVDMSLPPGVVDSRRTGHAEARRSSQDNPRRAFLPTVGTLAIKGKQPATFKEFETTKRS